MTEGELNALNRAIGNLESAVNSLESFARESQKEIKELHSQAAQNGEVIREMQKEFCTLTAQLGDHIDEDRKAHEALQTEVSAVTEWQKNVNLYAKPARFIGRKLVYIIATIVTLVIGGVAASDLNIRAEIREVIKEAVMLAFDVPIPNAGDAATSPPPENFSLDEFGAKE